MTGRVRDSKVSLGGQLGGANDLVLSRGRKSVSLNGSLSSGGERKRDVLGELTTDELANGRVSLVLGPRLVVLLPRHQAQVANEAYGAVVARVCRLVVEARLGERVWKHPFVVHVWPFVEGCSACRLAAHVPFIEAVPKRSSCSIAISSELLLNKRRVQPIQPIK